MVVVGGGPVVVVVVLGTVVVVVGWRLRRGTWSWSAQPGSWSSTRRRGTGRLDQRHGRRRRRRHRTMGCPGGRRDRSAGRARGRGRRRARRGRSGGGGGLRPDGRDGAHVVHASAPEAAAWSLRARRRRGPRAGGRRRRAPPTCPPDASAGRCSAGASANSSWTRYPASPSATGRAAFARVGPDPVLVHVDPFLVRRQRRWFPPEETACGQEAYVRLRLPAARAGRRTAVDGPWPRS